MDPDAPPDGAGHRSDPAPRTAPVRIAPWTGDRGRLRPLFELAEDSEEQVDAYLDAGTVLVASVGEQLVGHLQLVDVSADSPDPVGGLAGTAARAAVELKNMAVLESHQGRGIGRLLVEEAVRHARSAAAERMVVGTATADIGNLRFYQRTGFRMLCVERDAFVPATGYPDPVDIDGITLRDRVWLDRGI